MTAFLCFGMDSINMKQVTCSVLDHHSEQLMFNRETPSRKIATKPL